MKMKTLTLVVLVGCVTLTSAHADSFFFGIRDGRSGWHRHHWRRSCDTVIVAEPVPVAYDRVPYGYMRGGLVGSPWSDFTMSAGGKAPGQVVYDPNTGRPFRIP